jgi:S1-C subfamily serine protease
MDNQGRRWVIVAVSLVVLALCASTVAVLNVFLIREPQSAETTAVSPETPPDGLLIIHVVPDSPAERAGLQWGSFITAVNDTPMLETADLTNALQEAGAGSTVTLTLLVNGRSQTRAVTLNNAPPLLGVQVVGAGGIAPSASAATPSPPVVSRPWAQIRTVQPDTPASAAGLAEGDIVTAVDGQVVLDTAEFVAAIEGKQPGTAVALTVRRGTETLTLNATLTTHPDDPAKPYLGVTLDE